MTICTHCTPNSHKLRGCAQTVIGKLLLAGLCSLPLATMAQHTVSEDKRQKLEAELQQWQAALPAMRAFRDPVTGQLRAPNADEAQAMSTQRAAAAGAQRVAPASSPVSTLPDAQAPLQVQRHASGAASVRLDARHMHFATATRNADGNISYFCAEGHGHSTAALARNAHTHRTAANLGDKHDR
jgi:hypothetical protein